MSAITLIGVSNENYQFGTQFVVINIAYGLATPIAAYLYLPVFYNMRVTSAYEVSRGGFYCDGIVKITINDTASCGFPVSGEALRSGDATHRFALVLGSNDSLHGHRAVRASTRPRDGDRNLQRSRSCRDRNCLRFLFDHWGTPSSALDRRFSVDSDVRGSLHGDHQWNRQSWKCRRNLERRESRWKTRVVEVCDAVETESSRVNPSNLLPASILTRPSAILGSRSSSVEWERI